MAEWTASRTAVTAFLLLGVLLGPSNAQLHSKSALAEDVASDAEVSLIQRTVQEQLSEPTGERDLVLMHVPYNFGHTVENVAMFGSGVENLMRMVGYTMFHLGSISSTPNPATWEEVNNLKRPGGEVWGHLNPDLQVTNEVTGCPMYFSPAKYWPHDLQTKYFGDKKIFGLLRDPYERLVAFFRGGIPGYGGSYPGYLATCDVNGAVKKMMQEYIAGEDPFAKDCSMLPQAEFYEGPYGISIPVDNRQFPSSMNQVFAEHGYTDFHINNTEVIHVFLCNDVWAGDLDNETKALVRQVYAKDFELICKSFGYCEEGENTCIWQVPTMCPERVTARGYRG